MRVRGAIVLAAVVAAPGCDYLKDRTKTCQDIRVDIVNSQQTLAPIAIAGPGETFTSESVLASGASRTITLCVEKGDREEFRASLDGVVVAVARCVVERTPDEGGSSRVVWTLQGFLCQNW